MSETVDRIEHHQTSFLTVQELARLLHVNEKKIYQLAGEGDLPGTKITGKWIFPRQLIEDWINENSHAGVLSDRLIMVGSDDQLISQICNSVAVELQRSALVTYCPSGTRHGLQMLDTNKADVCFINWGAHEPHARRHLGLLRGYKKHGSWVLVRCMQRNQGLVFSDAASHSASSAVQLLSNHGLRWARRNSDSGSQRLLLDTYSQHNISQASQSKSTVTATLNTERSAIAAISTGAADIAVGSESSAFEYRLNFLPLAQISIDLVMTRRTYFRTLTQTFLKRLSDDKAQDAAGQLRGYTLLRNFDVLTIS